MEVFIQRETSEDYDYEDAVPTLLCAERQEDEGHENERFQPLFPDSTSASAGDGFPIPDSSSKDEPLIPCDLCHGRFRTDLSLQKHTVDAHWPKPYHYKYTNYRYRHYEGPEVERVNYATKRSRWSRSRSGRLDTDASSDSDEDTTAAAAVSDIPETEKNTVEVEVELKCPHCPKLFDLDDVASRGLHISLSHRYVNTPLDPKPIDVPIEIPVPKIPAPIAIKDGKQFKEATFEYLKPPEPDPAKSTDILVVSCPSCSKIFNDLASRGRHIRLNHRNK